MLLLGYYVVFPQFSHFQLCEIGNVLHLIMYLIMYVLIKYSLKVNINEYKCKLSEASPLCGVEERRWLVGALGPHPWVPFPEERSLPLPHLHHVVQGAGDDGLRAVRRAPPPRRRPDRVVVCWRRKRTRLRPDQSQRSHQRRQEARQVYLYNNPSNTKAIPYRQCRIPFL